MTSYSGGQIHTQRAFFPHGIMTKIFCTTYSILGIHGSLIEYFGIRPTTTNMTRIAAGCGLDTEGAEPPTRGQ